MKGDRVLANQAREGAEHNRATARDQDKTCSR